MSQQINLFNPLFLKQKKYFSAVTMVEALGVLLLGLGLFYGYAALHDANLSGEVAESTRVYEEQKKRFAVMAAELAPEKRNQELEQELKSLQAAVAAHRELLRETGSGAMGNTLGYSPYLRAFARQVLPGLWLTRVHIAEGGAELSLQGKAVQPELLPAYIKRLNAEPSLKGRPFDSLNIGRSQLSIPSAPAVAVVEFKLSSGTQHADETGAGKGESK